MEFFLKFMIYIFILNKTLSKTISIKTMAVREDGILFGIEDSAIHKTLRFDINNLYKVVTKEYKVVVQDYKNNYNQLQNMREKMMKKKKPMVFYLKKIHPVFLIIALQMK